MDAVATLLIVVFAFLSAMHVYWAFGGVVAAAVAVPEIDGKPAFRPGKAATLVVATGLAALAFLSAILNWPSILDFDHRPYSVAAGGLFSCVFALRAVGDFKRVGFFKKLENTKFARFDTLYYSPLSALLSILLGILTYLSNSAGS